MIVSNLLLLASLLPCNLLQNMGNPADKQQRPQKMEGEKDKDIITHSWELPAIVVPGQPLPELREEDKVGSYGQPRWTAHRRFAETRVYVIPEGQVEFEYWLVQQVERHNHDTQTKQQYEFEFGLPNRFQLDIYLVSHEDGNQGAMEFDETKTEVRWALADWDKIWGNPTLYLEWEAENNDADFIEAKLLLGGEMAPSWHWGLNLVNEQQTGGARELSREITAGVSKTLLDEKLSIGAEAKFAFVTDHVAGRGDVTHEFLIGPSIQYKPLPRVHLDIVPLVGITNEASRSQVTFIFGWEF